MPIYEYVCRDCSHRFEVKQGFNDPPLSTCERCGGTVGKVISAPAIMFKGSGWYVTDYSDKLKPPGGDGKPPAGDGKAEQKGEHKAEQKAEKKTDDKAKGDHPPAPAAAGSASSPSSSADGNGGGGSASSTPSSTPAKPSA